jgi:hypothetical protein
MPAPPAIWVAPGLGSVGSRRLQPVADCPAGGEGLLDAAVLTRMTYSSSVVHPLLDDGRDSLAHLDLEVGDHLVGDVIRLEPAGRQACAVDRGRARSGEHRHHEREDHRRGEHLEQRRPRSRGPLVRWARLRSGRAIGAADAFEHRLDLGVIWRSSASASSSST